MKRTVRRVVWILPIAAAAISLAVWNRLSQDDPPPATIADETDTLLRAAPAFSLTDGSGKLVRLKTFVGRSKIVLVFFDPTRGADRNALLDRVTESLSRLQKTGAVVIGISNATARQLRAAASRSGEAAFPLLSDASPPLVVHRQYEVWSPETNVPLEAVVVIDRAGLIQHTFLGPDGLGTPDEWVAKLESVR
jgi:peroxiredoxin